MKQDSDMEALQDDDIMIMEEMKSYIKGKRTKRRRPSTSSALTLTLACTTTTSSSTTTTTTTTTGATANHRSTFFHMPTTTSIDFTNNDEDMANCLILLAHGHNLSPPPSSSTTVVSPELYVYECKPCNRSFTSFQALGGHKASHNKPHKDGHYQPPRNRSSSSINPNKNLLCSPTPSGLTKGPKVHECSICGSDFTSGQALGGHMRRHRSMLAMAATATTCSAFEGSDHGFKKHKTLLPLDLNLPAPIEDDHKETKFRFSSNNQIIVFSAT